MSVPHPEDYEPGVDPAERAAFDALATRLVRDRPLPRPGFRGMLGRRLSKVGHTSTRTLRIRALAFAAAGALLLGVAGVGALDAGPLAPTSQHAQVSQR